jgi:serine protease Do
MKLSEYEEHYEFEVPEYDGNITDSYEEDYEEDYDEGYGNDTGLDLEEEYPAEDPYLYELTSHKVAAIPIQAFQYGDY